MRKTGREIIKFAVVGFSNFVIIMLTAWALTELVGINYLVSNVAAYLLAFVNNFYWNRVWVFRSADRRLRRQVALFLTAYGCAYAVQLATVFTLVEWVGVRESAAQFVGLFPFGAVNFLMNQRITFKR